MAHMPETIIIRKTGETKTAVEYSIVETKTNADRIRAMSDEELAHFIWNRDIDIVEKASVAGHFTFTVDREKCFKNVLDWLKKEAEE